MLNTFITIMKYVFFYLLGHFTGKFFVALYNYLKDMKGKHFCNECEAAFTENKNELEYKYCPYCSKPLQEINLDKD